MAVDPPREPEVERGYQVEKRDGGAEHEGEEDELSRKLAVEGEVDIVACSSGRTERLKNDMVWFGIVPNPHPRP